MENLKNLFDNNRQWARKIVKQHPRFFELLSQQQAPKYLWVGCSDSRVPANEIVGLLPGELFVHRNVGNLVVHTDLNCLSVIQYAVEVLRVEHIIVCGHYGCGAVNAVIEKREFGLVNNWLRHLEDLMKKHPRDFSSNINKSRQIKRLCEINVQSQVENVCRTTVVQDAWSHGQSLTVHGWIYDIHDGLLKNLIGDVVTSSADLKRYVKTIKP